jgi:hypothetical protein
MTATATTATVYQVSVSTFVPFEGEYFVAYYATSVAAAQRLLVAAIEASGWKLDDYEVANWNGTSTSTVRKAIADNLFYTFDAGHGSGKTRIMVNISEARVNSRKGARDFAKECATALAAGQLGDITAREIRLKKAYPAKPTTEPITQTTIMTTKTTTPELTATAYATLNVHPKSAYAYLNGQRLVVKEVLCNGNLALVMPNQNGNTADFTPAEVVDYAPATAQLVDYGITGLTEQAAYDKQVEAVNQINRALMAGQAVVMRTPGQVEAPVLSAQIFPERITSLPRLVVQLEDSVEQPVWPLDRIFILLPAPCANGSGLLCNGCPTNQKSTLRLPQPNMRALV